MRRSVRLIAGLTALCISDPSLAASECIELQQRGRSVVNVKIISHCDEPMTVTIFNAQGTEVINVPPKKQIDFATVRLRSWRVCSGVSVTRC